ncbi:alpha/beta fold hydrolase [Streptomyces sp. NPDC052396]|uniref:alpha/beta fold hydrolase n=1 Tax=Streptomyces sp. NPDC052396 TaxID=3365689 RepID=UPI0037CDDBD7
MSDHGGPAVFHAAYRAVLRRWPQPVRGLDVPTAYGSTRVHIWGDQDGAPLVLLPGGGDTSAVWFAAAGELGRRHRVYAVDLLGDFGLSVPEGRPLRRPGDLMAWLDQVYDALELTDGAHLCGHSYGAWIALHYALHAPHRVGRLALLEPTGCFTGLRPGYLAHAIPLLLGTTPERLRRFRRWESGGEPAEAVWREFLDSTAHAHRTKVFPMRRPPAAGLRGCAVPTLVLVAERSRAHDPGKVAAGARRLLPRVTVDTLPGVSHHSLPTERPDELCRQLLEFLK